MVLSVHAALAMPALGGVVVVQTRTTALTMGYAPF
jgi:hypothetical protein